MTIQTRYAKFYDICDKINPNYYDEEFVTDEMLEGMEERIEKHVIDNNYKFGDILFVGSSYETRPYYGFRIVMENGKLGEGEPGYSLPFENYIDKKLEKENVKYHKLFEDIKNWDKVKYAWGEDFLDDDIIPDYISSNIWK